MSFLIKGLVIIHLTIIILSITTFIYSRSITKYKYQYHRLYLLAVYALLFFCVFVPSDVFSFISPALTEKAMGQKDSALASNDIYIFYSQLQTNSLYRVVTTVFEYCFYLGCIHFLLALAQLFSKAKNLIVKRRIGNMYLCGSQNKGIPYTFSLLNRSYIVIPDIYCSRRESLKNIIAHEIQHIKLGDTKTVYVLQFIRSSFFINPFVHCLVSSLRNLHEVIVDERLIQQGKCERQSYLKTMQFVFDNYFNNQPSMAKGFFGRQLIREYKMRIDSLNNGSKQKWNKVVFSAAGILLILSISCAHSAATSVTNAHDTSDKSSGKTYQINMKILNDNKTVANPKIVTREGEEATIMVMKDSSLKNPKNKSQIEVDANDVKAEFRYSVVAKNINDSLVELDITGTVFKNGKKSDLSVAERVEIGKTQFSKVLNAELNVSLYK